MEAFKCVNCSKVHPTKSGLISCSCGKGTDNIVKPVTKKEIIEKSVSARKKAVAEIEAKELTKDTKKASKKNSKALPESED